jgi:hypothetical protein
MLEVPKETTLKDVTMQNEIARKPTTMEGRAKKRSLV